MTPKPVIPLILLIFLYAVPMTGTASLMPANDPAKEVVELKIREAAGLINASSYDEAEDILYGLLERDLPDWGKVCFLLGRLYMLLIQITHSSGDWVRVQTIAQLRRLEQMERFISGMP